MNHHTIVLHGYDQRFPPVPIAECFEPCTLSRQRISEEKKTYFPEHITNFLRTRAQIEIDSRRNGSTSNPEIYFRASMLEILCSIENVILHER
mmetsp:Transcript_31149/g.65271  ORF Transcript_31149/g.65271 Transcript_31149/m.65271 type:complete len:93 (-) Transcript_31149:486-764(-)